MKRTQYSGDLDMIKRPLGSKLRSCKNHHPRPLGSKLGRKNHHPLRKKSSSTNAFTILEISLISLSLSRSDYHLVLSLLSMNASCMLIDIVETLFTSSLLSLPYWPTLHVSCLLRIIGI